MYDMTSHLSTLSALFKPLRVFRSYFIGHFNRNKASVVAFIELVKNAVGIVWVWVWMCQNPQANDMTQANNTRKYKFISNL